ncbi:unnamed protein product [Symbiodinium sp. KB8]|nr:unnamed protein product [Symbiodinium sp. KB8]
MSGQSQGWLCFLNLFGFAVNFILTGYAQSQLQTFASVSEKYPAPAIPAGWAFSIWAVIYLWECIMTLAFLSSTSSRLLLALGPWWFFASMLQGAWALSFSSEWVAVSSLCMLGLLLSLATAAAKVRLALLTEPDSAFWLVSCPLSIHFGWIVAAASLTPSILLSCYAPNHQTLRTCTAAAGCLLVVLANILVTWACDPPDWPAAAAMTWALCGTVSSLQQQSRGYSRILPESAVDFLLCEATVVAIAVSGSSGARLCTAFMRTRRGDSFDVLEVGGKAALLHTLFHTAPVQQHLEQLSLENGQLSMAVILQLMVPDVVVSGVASSQSAALCNGSILVSACAGVGKVMDGKEERLSIGPLTMEFAMDGRSKGLRHGYEEMGAPACRAYAHQLHFLYASVRGFVYKQRPSLRDPLWLLKAAAGLHRAVRLERWAEDARTWLEITKPFLQGEANDLQTTSERLEDLCDKDLLLHVEACMHFMALATETHRRFTPASVLPLLNLIDFCRKHVQQWDVLTVLELVQSNASKSWWQQNFGAYGAVVQGLVTHLDHDLELCCMFELDIQNPDVARRVWEKLEEKPYAKQILSGASYCSVGPDIHAPTLREEKVHILMAIKAGLARPPANRKACIPARRVLPEKYEEELRVLFDLAVKANPIPEDRYSFHYRSVALLRIAVLECGRRSVQRGYLEEAEHVIAAASLRDLARALQQKMPRLAHEFWHFSKLRAAASATSDSSLAPPSALPPSRAGSRKLRFPSCWQPLFRLTSTFPDVPLFKVSNMFRDWQRLDGPEPLAWQPEALPESNRGFVDEDVASELPGIAVCLDAPSVKGVARVGVEGLIPGEILVVEYGSSSHAVYFPMLKALAGDSVNVSSFEKGSSVAVRRSPEMGCVHYICT